jgi:hypothetical protein
LARQHDQVSATTEQHQQELQAERVKTGRHVVRALKKNQELLKTRDEDELIKKLLDPPPGNTNPKFSRTPRMP